jgi:outer membrane protein OmpA-like peptidoglycan-associated protein
MIIKVVALFLATFTALVAQETPSWGVLAGGSYVHHEASFQRLGDYPSCCPSFTGGDAFSIHAGAFYRKPLTSFLAIEGRFVAAGEHGSMKDQETTFVADLRDTLRVVRATLEHTLDASLLTLGIEPIIAMRLTKGFDLLVGSRIGVNIQQSFQQTETLTKPEDYGAYLGADRTWVATQAQIPNTQPVRFSILAGMRARLPQRPASSVGLGFELIYSHGLTNVVSGVPWLVHQLRLSAVLTFSRTQNTAAKLDTCLHCPPEIAAMVDPVITPEVPKIQSNHVEPPTKTTVPAIIEVTGVSDGDTTRGLINVVERNRRVIVLHPLLGHVYFDGGSSRLPERYKRAIALSRNDTLNLRPIDALQGELGIIAQRMKAHPDAWLSIVGTTSGSRDDEGIQLARARAEEVRRTMNELGIYDDRLRVSARVFPEKPTTFSDTSAQTLAQEENRRVELSSNNPAILAPIKLGTTERTHKPDALIVQGKLADDRSGLDLKLRIRRGGTVIAEQRSSVGKEQAAVELDLSKDLDRTSGDSIVVDVVTVRDGKEESVATKSIPVLRNEEELTQTERSGDLIIERYGLILFDFDEVRISKQHERQLQFIRSRIRENTSVMVIGATDQIGSQPYNRELSLKRAKEVSKRLGVPGAIVVGNGEDSPSLPNELPEGRAFNRTVVIQLATPVK